MTPAEYIKDINRRRARYKTTDFGDSVNKILEHALCAVKKKYSVTDDNSSDITNAFYRETRCRNHFGKEMALNSICNNYQMAPLLDSALTKINLKGCHTANRNLILAVIFDRYCPELLNFKFDSNRSIEKTILEYAHEINSKYPLNEKTNHVEGKWFLKHNLKYNTDTIEIPVTAMQVNALFLNSFLSERTYKLFTKYFSKEIYDDALHYSQKTLFHPEARYIPILGIVKILTDVTEKSGTGFSPFKFFKSLLTDDRYYKNAFSYINYTLQTARIDIKNFSDENNNNDISISLNDNSDCLLEKPRWFHKNGVGYVITTSRNEGIDIKITCLNDGLLSLALRSIDIRDKNNQRINYFVDYTKFVIDDQIKFDYIMPCSHDKPFLYTLPVKTGQCMVIHLEWQKHDYNISDYFKIVSLIEESFLDAKEFARRNIENAEKVKMLEKEKAQMQKRLQRLKQKYDNTEEKLEKEKSKVVKLKTNLRITRNGWSFRLGRAITWLPRIIKKSFKC